MSKKTKKIRCYKIFIKFKTKDCFPIDYECHKISRKNFESILKQLLIDHNCFITNTGFYRQTQGLSMGSKLSSLLANLYVNDIEEKNSQTAFRLC